MQIYYPVFVNLYAVKLSEREQRRGLKADERSYQ